MNKALLILSWLLLAVCCKAEIIIVDDDGPADFNNIQAAIDDSNDGDIIYVFPGRYTGDGNTNILFKGKAVTVQSVGPEDPYIVAATIIDCNGGYSGFGFFYWEGPNSVVDGLTIANGSTGIDCYEGSPIIRNCTIRDCSWTGIILYQSSALITNCTITGNGTPGTEDGEGGGGITCGEWGKPTVTNCLISDNHAWIGGGINCHFDEGWTADMSISNCTFIANSATQDGAAIAECKGPITGCTFIANLAGDDGGALSYCLGPISNCTFIDNKASINPDENGHGAALYNCWVPVTNCLFINNSAGGKGGAICWGHPNIWAYPNINAEAYFYPYPNPAITNCLFTANSSGDDGGALYAGFTGPLAVTNCTFSGNWAAYFGGGIANDTDILAVTNCILWGNTDSSGTGQDAQISGWMPSATFSCIQDDDPNDPYIPFGGEDNNNIDDNPAFVRDPNDGGDGWGDDPCTPDVNEGANDDFGDLHLERTSPCINAGDPFTWLGSNSVDMDGEPRIMGAVIDMGADEFLIPMIVVTRPQGGDVWVGGSWHEIAWDSHAFDGTVDIWFSRNGGMSWQVIEGGVAGTGSYFWELPETVDSSQCVILVVPSDAHPDVICIESGLFTIHPDSPGPPVTSRWKSLGGDFDRAGLSEDYGPELGCVKWTFETGAAIAASITIGAYDRVHISCEDGKLYTLDSNGVLLWSYDTNSPLLSSPSVGPDGSLYVGSEDGRLYAIDVNGSLRWTHTADGFIYSSPAVSADGNNIYVGCKDGILYALARDGSELWSFEMAGFGVIGGSIFASPAVAGDGTVYIGGLYDPNLYALDPNDGSVKWDCNFEYPIMPWVPNSSMTFGWPFASPVVAADGTIYQTLLYDANLYAIEPNDGSIIWSLQLTERPGWDRDSRCFRGDVDGWSEPALGPDGTIYVSLNDANLRAVDPNGSIKWVTRLGMTDGFTLTVGSNGLVYAAGGDGYLCVVDANGVEVSRFQGNNWVTFPVVSADNTVIVADANRIWAIGAEACEDSIYHLHRPEDLDGSLSVNAVDFALLAADWLACNDASPPCEAYYWDGTYFTGDIDRNLYVDFADLAAITDRWLSVDLPGGGCWSW